MASLVAPDALTDLVSDLRVVAEMFPPADLERREVVLRAADVIEALDQVIRNAVSSDA